MCWWHVPIVHVATRWNRPHNAIHSTSVEDAPVATRCVRPRAPPPRNRGAPLPAPRSASASGDHASRCEKGHGWTEKRTATPSGDTPFPMAKGCPPSMTRRLFLCVITVAASSLSDDWQPRLLERCKFRVRGRPHRLRWRWFLRAPEPRGCPRAYPWSTIASRHRCSALRRPTSRYATYVSDRRF